MGAITSENAYQAIQKLVATDALPTLVGNLVMGNLVNRDFEAALNLRGDQVNIPIPPVLTAQNIAETGTLTNQAAPLGNATITLTNHDVVAFSLPDAVKILTNPDLLGLYLEPAMTALAEKIERHLLNTYTKFLLSAGSASAAITESVLDDAETALFTNKVPRGREKYLVVHEDVYKTLRNIQRFSEVDKIGSGQSIVTGEVGRLKNFAIARSQYAPKVSTTYHSVAFVRDTIGFAIRRLPAVTAGGAQATYAEFGSFGLRIISSYSHGTLAEQWSADVLYGADVIRPTFGVDIQSNG